MVECVGNGANSSSVRRLLLAIGVAMVVPIGACNSNQQSAPVQAGPRTFSSPEDAGKALAEAAKSQNQNAILQIFGPGSAEILSTGDATEDKASLDGFAKAYQVMNRWRKLGDGTELLLVGADNQAFPIPLMKNSAGQWYFDAAAGKEEILARRIGRNEIAAIDICASIADAQQQYFAQHHDGVNQYAQKFISDEGKQNGLYWPEVSGQPRSPLGPLIAFATSEGYKVQPSQHQPFYGYYFALLDKQGPNAKGGAKDYVANGKKMTGGFAVLAYPAEYRQSGVMSFLINQNGPLLEKDLGNTTDQVASAMTEFNPDRTWTVVE
jgi:Protein of unknown function (DUF2950)